MRTQELEDIVEEEASITEDDEKLERELTSALVKLRSGDYSFTSAERNAIRHALMDVGELYLYTGTSSGFDVESEEQLKEHQQRGRRAFAQAKKLGIRGFK